MLKQISVYAENKKGAMRALTSILVREQINILGSVTNDSAEYGIVRMVVDAPDKAIKALQEAGVICRLCDVIGVEVTDEVGNLDRLLACLEEINISVDYIYLSYNRESGKPIMVFHTEDPSEVEDSLKNRGFMTV